MIKIGLLISLWNPPKTFQVATCSSPSLFGGGDGEDLIVGDPQLELEVSPCDDPYFL